MKFTRSVVEKRQDKSEPSGFVISALRGGSGKTLISIGIVAAWSKSGKKIAPFKKGPDYIDAGWLSLAAGGPCYNLDTFLINQPTISQSFNHHTLNTDFAVIEGNRGLYDGIDSTGSTSTAELAKLLGLPVILCIDCTKSTRTMGAVVLGCICFDPDVKIQGVILNRVAGSRHEQILRKTIEQYCDVPVVGALPKLSVNIFPERHMGLVPTPEHLWAAKSLDKAAEIAETYIDFNALAEIAGKAASPVKLEEMISTSPLGIFPSEAGKGNKDEAEAKPLIGICKDSAFQFYYPENLDALKIAGAEIVFISPLEDSIIPDLDALYIGGGFPETHAEKLAANRGFLNALKNLAMAGLPIYAECGGLMFLGEKMVIDGASYKMSSILPLSFSLSQKPQGHGYTKILVEKENPFFKVGTTLRGHEFHYSKVLTWDDGAGAELVFSMERGTGLINKKDGISMKNVFATYSHIHALGTPDWAKAVVRNANCYKKGRADN